MYRVVATSFFCELLTSPVVKRQASRLLPFSNSWSSSNFRVSSSRHLASGFPLRKDVTQPKTGPNQEMEKIDLDAWKSMMRSQGTVEIQGHHEEESGGEDVASEHLVTNKDVLEATRDLVLMWRQAGKTVPEQISDDDVKALAQLTTKSSKKRYLKFLAIKEGYRKARQEKQLQKRTEKEAQLENTREEIIMHDEENGTKFRKSFLLKFWSRSLDKLLAWRSAQAMIFGQPLIFDMSYEKNMTRREIDNTVNQLMEVEGWNRRSSDPFHLHYCNLQPNGAYKEELIKRYSGETWDHLLVTSTDRQHVNMFPHDRLVYLTADSPNVLRTFDHSKIYIIGALVDRSIQSGVSLANAKRLKLATARLPLDEFLHWGCGAKNLTLDQMIRILLTVKDTGSWEKALQFVPKRKHDGLHNNSAKATHRWKDKYDERTSTGYKTSDVKFRGGVKSFSNSFRNPDFLNGDNKRKRDRIAVSKMENIKITGKNNKTWWTKD